VIVWYLLLGREEGALGSKFLIHCDRRLNHHYQAFSGLLAEQCSELDKLNEAVLKTVGFAGSLSVFNAAVKPSHNASPDVSSNSRDERKPESSAGMQTGAQLHVAGASIAAGERKQSQPAASSSQSSGGSILNANLGVGGDLTGKRKREDDSEVALGQDAKLAKLS
jgi:hypothetical protein